MKDRKIKFRYFTIMEWEKEQDFLRREGLKGWRFTKATLLGIYHFEKCDSQRTICPDVPGLRLGIYPGLFRLQLFPEAGF